MLIKFHNTKNYCLIAAILVAFKLEFQEKKIDIEKVTKKRLDAILKKTCLEFIENMPKEMIVDHIMESVKLVMSMGVLFHDIYEMQETMKEKIETDD